MSKRIVIVSGGKLEESVCLPILEGQKEGFTVLSGEQTGGRGRTGRSFYSPADTGVYMSLLLRPENCSPVVAVKFTTMAAVAACRAIEMVSQKKAQIKWVNDVFIEDKKVCGILTEGAVSLEKGSRIFKRFYGALQRKDGTGSCPGIQRSKSGTWKRYPGAAPGRPQKGKSCRYRSGLSAGSGI